jgi:hypothetical protein
LRSPLRIIRAVVAIVVAYAAGTGIALAQAWVPERGEGSVTFTYQNYDVAGHFNASGNKGNDASTYSQSVVTELDYGVTSALGLTLTLPVIASKYTGPPEYSAGGYKVPLGPLDNGNYHAAVQDLRIEVRRLFWAKSIAVAPFGGISFPTHEYETAGEAVPGRHRRDYQVGASAGSDLGPAVPNAYVQVRYAYGTMQKIDDIPFTRSNIDVEGGKAPVPWLLLRGLLNWQIRHQGPTLDDLYADGLWTDHDRFVVSSFFNVGAGSSVSLTRSLDVYGVYVVTVAGSNGAHRGRLFAVGTTWGFGRTLGGLIGGHAVPAITRATGPSVFR